jgi:hypothetical protein
MIAETLRIAKAEFSRSPPTIIQDFAIGHEKVDDHIDRVALA